jgi:hypothetical protein
MYAKVTITDTPLGFGVTSSDSQNRWGWAVGAGVEWVFLALLRDANEH